MCRAASDTHSYGSGGRESERVSEGEREKEKAGRRGDEAVPILLLFQGVIHHYESVCLSQWGRGEAFSFVFERVSTCTSPVAHATEKLPRCVCVCVYDAGGDSV